MDLGRHAGQQLQLAETFQLVVGERDAGDIERLPRLSLAREVGLPGDGSALPSTRLAAGELSRLIFHLLRLQALCAERRPLVILEAKALLRHPAAVSALAEGSAFKPVIASRGADGAVAERVVFCSGNIAYDLEREALARGLGRINIVRIVSLNPFPHAELAAEARRSPDAHFVYVQEEPRNMGAWDYHSARLARAAADGGARHAAVDCVSRPASGSPAGSFHGWQERDQAELLARALSGCAGACPVTIGGGAA